MKADEIAVKRRVDATARVIQDEAKPVDRNILAQSILRIEAAATGLRRSSGLNDRALVLLIAESSRVSRGDVTAVLKALENLKRDWCR